MNVVSDLTAPLGAGAPSDAGAEPSVPERPRQVVAAIVNGQIPGAYVPADAVPGDAQISPEDLLDTGVGIYRPKQTKAVAAVLFDPKSVNEKEMQSLDASGKITEVFPDVTSLLSGPASESGGLPGAGASAGTQMTAPVPVQSAGSALPASAQNSLATKRIEALNGSLPSERPLPARGAILNGLAVRAS